VDADRCTLRAVLMDEGKDGAFNEGDPVRRESFCKLNRETATFCIINKEGT